MAENEHFEEGHEPNQGSNPASPSNPNSQSDSMLRPWMRTLGKKYYQNEYLGKFETLDDAVDALLRRPEPKDVPESYGQDEDIEKAFREARLTKAEADSIAAAYKSRIPEPKKDLKEYFGDKYDRTIESYTKGIGSFADDMKSRITESGLDKDPLFIEVMARVGNETGGENFRRERHPEGSKVSPAEMLVKHAYGIK